MGSVPRFLDQAAGEAKRLQELPSSGVLFCFGQVGECLQETGALVRRQSQQLPAHTFHQLHRGVGIYFVVIAAFEKPESIDNHLCKGWHKRIYDGHFRNLADAYDV